MSFNEEATIKQTLVYRKLEREAELLYEEIISNITDREIIGVLDKIRQDEIRHQQVVSKILGILKSNFPDKYEEVHDTL